MFLPTDVRYQPQISDAALRNNKPRQINLLRKLPICESAQPCQITNTKSETTCEQNARSQMEVGFCPSSLASVQENQKTVLSGPTGCSLFRCNSHSNIHTSYSDNVISSKSGYDGLPTKRVVPGTESDFWVPGLAQRYSPESGLLSTTGVPTSTTCPSDETLSNGNAIPLSHCRLRTALLTSGRATSNPTIPPQAHQLPLDKNRLIGLALPSKSCESTTSPPELGLMNTPFSQSHADSTQFAQCIVGNGQRTSTSAFSDVATGSGSLNSPSTRSLTRPPSASNILRRASCDEYTDLSGSQIKSFSQPQSPDFRPRLNTLPISPCRLPMKKRKVDWNQLNDLAAAATPTATSTTVQSTFQTYATTVSTTKGASKPSQSRSQPTVIGGQNPLVIDCPLSSATGDSLVYADKKLAPDATTSTTCLVNPSSMDPRPRSIPAYLTSLESHDELNTFEQSLSTRCPNTSSQNSSMPQDHVKIAESRESLSSRLSLLARTLTSMSDLSRASGNQNGAHCAAPYCRPYPLNASDPCIRATENRDKLDYRFLSNILTGRPQPTLDAPRNEQQDGPWSSEAVHAMTQRTTLPPKLAPSILEPDHGFHEPPQLSFLAQPSTTVSENFSMNTNQSVARMQSALPGSSAVAASSESCPPRSLAAATTAASEPSSSTGSGLLDGAQVLMMLSPASKEMIGTPVEKSAMTTVNGSSCLAQNSESLSALFRPGARRSFPLLLISASSSAGAAALAAAAAVASGAPPSSLIPVPVQLTAYVPPPSNGLQSPISDSASNGSGSDAANSPRFMISLCTSPMGDRTAAEENTVSQLSSLTDKLKTNSVTSPSDFRLSVPSIPMSHTAALAHPTA